MKVIRQLTGLKPKLAEKKNNYYKGQLTRTTAVAVNGD